MNSKVMNYLWLIGLCASMMLARTVFGGENKGTLATIKAYVKPVYKPMKKAALPVAKFIMKRNELNMIRGGLVTTAVAYPLSKISTFDAQLNRIIPAKIVPSLFNENKRLCAAVAAGIGIWGAIEYIARGGIPQLTSGIYEEDELKVDSDDVARFITTSDEDLCQFMPYTEQEAQYIKSIRRDITYESPAAYRWKARFQEFQATDLVRVLFFGGVLCALTHYYGRMGATKTQILKTLLKTGAIAWLGNMFYKRVCYPWREDAMEAII